MVTRPSPGPATAPADLEREALAPSAHGWRSPVWTPIAAGLTPRRLSAVLAAAAQGQDLPDWFALAAEIEERDLHYASVLGTRKRAVARLPLTVEAASDAPADQAVADQVRALTAGAGFRHLLVDLLDGLGKGVSAVEILWDTRRTPWRPARYAWRDPRWLAWDPVAGWGLRPESGTGFAPLPPDKFILHEPRLRSGASVRGGLTRVAAWAWIVKAFTLRDWASFAEVFGMPLRLGRYDRAATEEDRRALLRAVRSIAADAAAIVPQGMEIEFVQAGAGGGEAVFGGLAQYLDKQLSKLVLGGTMTSDDGSSLAQAKVHDAVRDDIRDADAMDLADTLQRDLIAPFVRLNFAGRQPPQLRLAADEAEDLDALAARLEKLVPLGLAVEASVVRDRLGLPDPAPGAMVLSAPNASVVAGHSDAGRARNRAGGAMERALQATPAVAASDPIDALWEEAAAEWQPVIDPFLAPVRQAVAAATDYGDLLARLAAIAPDAERPAPWLMPLMDRLALLQIAALAAGDPAETKPAQQDG